MTDQQAGMKFRYAFKWSYIELVVVSAMTWVLHVGLHPEWWGWLLYFPLFAYMVFEGVRKVSYSLTVEGDSLTIVNYKVSYYSVSRIAAVNVWDAKAGRIAVVDFSDGNRFHFSSRLDGFDKLVSLLRTKAKLPSPG